MSIIRHSPTSCTCLHFIPTEQVGLLFPVIHIAPTARDVTINIMKPSTKIWHAKKSYFIIKIGKLRKQVRGDQIESTLRCQYF